MREESGEAPASRDGLMKGLGLKRQSYNETPRVSHDTMAGYLLKASFGTWNNVSWNHRWFVLNIPQGILCYYKRKPKRASDETDQLEKNVQQLYYLRQVGAVCTTQHDPNCAPKLPQAKLHYFQVRVVQDLKKWQDTSAFLHLCVNSKAHQEQWVLALTAAIDGTSHEPLPMDLPLRGQVAESDVPYESSSEDSENEEERNEAPSSTTAVKPVQSPIAKPVPTVFCDPGAVLSDSGTNSPGNPSRQSTGKGSSALPPNGSPGCQPLSPHDKPGTVGPTTWLKKKAAQTMKTPAKLPEITWVAGKERGGVLCGYLDKNFVSRYQMKSKVQWHKRFFSLDVERRMLYYYKAGVRPELLHRTLARGWIDLSRPGTSFIVDRRQMDQSLRHSPMPFQFQIEFPGEGGRNVEILKLCASSEDAYLQWVEAIGNAVAGRPSAALSNQSESLVQFSGSEAPIPPYGGSLEASPVSRGEDHKRAPNESLGDGHHVPMTSHASSRKLQIRRRASVLKRAEPSPRQSAAPVVAVAPQPIAITKQVDLKTALIGFNVLVALLFFGGIFALVLAILGGNVLIWKSLYVPKPKPVYGISARRAAVDEMPTAEISDDDEGEDDEEEDDDPEEGEDEEDRHAVSTLLPTTPSASAPIPPSFARRRHVPNKLRHIGGQTLSKMAKPDETQCWSVPDPSTFHVRVGPNYAKNKQKAPSQGKILTPVAADIFTCDNKVDHVTQYLQFPEVDFEVAHWFIINAQVPSYPPANPVWGTGVLDGPGMLIVVYNPITPELWESIQSATSGHLELFRRFLTADQMPNPTEVYDRFKIIAALVNYDDPTLNLNATCTRLVKTWNCKPVLTRPQHKIIHSDFYTEVDINLHEFSYLPRRGIAGFMPKVKDMIMNVCLVVEAQTDTELPEVVLTCFTLNKVDLEKGKPW